MSINSPFSISRSLQQNKQTNICAKLTFTSLNTEGFQVVLLFINLLLNRMHLKYCKTAPNPSNFSMAFSSVAQLGRGIQERKPALAESRVRESGIWGVWPKGAPRGGTGPPNAGPWAGATAWAQGQDCHCSNRSPIRTLVTSGPQSMHLALEKCKSLIPK